MSRPAVSAPTGQSAIGSTAGSSPSYGYRGAWCGYDPRHSTGSSRRARRERLQRRGEALQLRPWQELRLSPTTRSPCERMEIARGGRSAPGPARLLVAPDPGACPGALTAPLGEGRGPIRTADL